MNGTLRVLGAVCAVSLLTSLAGGVQAQSQAPLPDGYMRAPVVPSGLAPAMRVTETRGAAHVFDANFSAGDEILSGLTDLAVEQQITSGYVTGLGGLSGALLAWGDPEVGAFKMIPIDEKCELISLLGHIAVRDGKPTVHLHAVVGFRDGSTKAGHVMEARVAPLAEISVVATSIGAAAPQASRAADEAAIRAVIQGFLDTRERNDQAGLAALMTADVDQRQTSGNLRSGREAVVTGTLTTQQSTGGRRTIAVDSIRFFGADVAMADGRYDSLDRNDGSDQRMLASIVLQREGGEWKIAAIRNMLPTEAARPR